MRNYVTIALIVLLQSSLFAQSEEPRAYIADEDYNWWAKSIGDEGIVFADIAYIRDYPSTKGKILDSLKNGDKVKILSKGYNPSTIRGFSAPWHKIEYLINGHKKEGFIWLGLLALGKKTHNNNGNQYIFGILKHNKETSYSPSTDLIEVKVLDNTHNLLDRAQYPAQLYGQTYVESKLLPNMGLDSLQSIYRVGFLGEACAISSNHYYFGWTGSKLIPMFYKTSVSDAGVSYYEEKVLFPSEHQLDKKLIIKDIEEGEVIDDEADEPTFKITRQRKKYIWDGKMLSEVLELK